MKKKKMVNQPKSRGAVASKGPGFKVHFWNFPVTLGKWLHLSELPFLLRKPGAVRETAPAGCSEDCIPQRR